MKRDHKPTSIYWVIVFGSAIGLVASFIQLMDKMVLLADNGATLVCNINSALSCSSVLNAPQASVLGPPNALISTVVFSFLLGVGLVGATGGVVSKTMRFITQFIALFTLAFGMWFLHQSIFVIGSLCIYCIFNTFGLLVINASWLKLNYHDIKLGARFNSAVNNLVQNNYDILVWVAIAFLIAASAIIKFL